ncbi:hypothetical protein ACU40M_10485 [Staphylococcus arlettae]
MRFQEIIQKSLNNKTKSTYIDTVKDSIKIDSFIEETDDYITFEIRKETKYLIMKDKIVGIRTTNKTGTHFLISL